MLHMFWALGSLRIKFVAYEAEGFRVVREEVGHEFRGS